MTKGEQMRPWVDRLWRAANYHLQRTATAVYRQAIRDGLLLPAEVCEDCGRSGRIHGHHEDYSRPLDVIWLCPFCHAGWHRHRWYHHPEAA